MNKNNFYSAKMSEVKPSKKHVKKSPTYYQYEKHEDSDDLSELSDDASPAIDIKKKLIIPRHSPNQRNGKRKIHQIAEHEENVNFPKKKKKQSSEQNESRKSKLYK